MLLFRVLVVPNYCAGSLFNNRTVDILAILRHYLSNCLHPLEALHFKKFGPLISIRHQPVAAFCCHPKVLLVHQIRLKDV